MRSEIEAKTHLEDEHAVVCYTKIRTDDQSFYQEMQKYEIYNNRVALEHFKETVLNRYVRWNGAPMIEFRLDLIHTMIAATAGRNVKRCC